MWIVPACRLFGDNLSPVRTPKHRGRSDAETACLVAFCFTARLVVGAPRRLAGTAFQSLRSLTSRSVTVINLYPLCASRYFLTTEALYHPRHRAARHVDAPEHFIQAPSASLVRCPFALEPLSVVGWDIFGVVLPNPLSRPSVPRLGPLAIKLITG